MYEIDTYIDVEGRIYHVYVYADVRICMYVYTYVRIHAVRRYIRTSVYVYTDVGIAYMRAVAVYNGTVVREKHEDVCVQR